MLVWPASVSPNVMTKTLSYHLEYEVAIIQIFYHEII